MKKHCSLFLIVIMITTIMSFPISVTAIEAEPIPINASFINTASIDVTTCDNNLFKISLTGTEKIPNNPNLNTLSNNDVNASYKTTSLTFLADTSKEKDRILSQINQVKSSGGTQFDDEWFLGSSCYIYVSAVYTKKDGARGDLAKINSVTTKHSVNSGTRISKATLRVKCQGVTSDDKGYINEKTINVTTTPYTNTSMNSWPYLYMTGPYLGASYEVIAARQSGNPVTEVVNATIFLN